MAQPSGFKLCFVNQESVEKSLKPLLLLRQVASLVWPGFATPAPAEIRDLVKPSVAIPEGKGSLVTKVWEKVIEGGEIQFIQKSLKIDPKFTELRCRKRPPHYFYLRKKSLRSTSRRTNIASTLVPVTAAV
jgi:hypothetical protein